MGIVRDNCWSGIALFELITNLVRVILQGDLYMCGARTLLRRRLVRGCLILVFNTLPKDLCISKQWLLLKCEA